MKDIVRVLGDIATLSYVDGRKVTAVKLHEAADYIARLEERLEVYTAPNEKTGEVLYLGIGHVDGIGCRDETIKMLDENNNALKDGSCRFNCRNRKDTWISGFRGCMKYFNWGKDKMSDDDLEKQYKIWRVNDGKHE